MLLLLLKNVNFKLSICMGSLENTIFFAQYKFKCCKMSALSNNTEYLFCPLSMYTYSVQYIGYYFLKQAHIITNLNFLMIISCVFLSSFIMLPPIKFCKYRKRGNVVWVAEPVPRAQCESLVKL